MTRSMNQVQPASPHSRHGNGQPDIYVATNFFTWVIQDGHRYSHGNFILNGLAYRKLDPTYYAWLRGYMLGIQEKFSQGEISKETYEKPKGWFNYMHRNALVVFGKKRLLRAMESFRKANFSPPRNSENGKFWGLFHLPEHVSNWPPSLFHIYVDLAWDHTKTGVDIHEAGIIAKEAAKLLIESSIPPGPGGLCEF